MSPVLLEFLFILIKDKTSKTQIIKILKILKREKYYLTLLKEICMGRGDEPPLAAYNPLPPPPLPSFPNIFCPLVSSYLVDCMRKIALKNTAHFLC